MAPAPAMYLWRGAVISILYTINFMNTKYKISWIQNTNFQSEKVVTTWNIIVCIVFNRPGVAGAVL